MAEQASRTELEASGERRDARLQRGGARRGGLLVDWGGVMTNSPFTSFAAFCESEGLDPATLVSAFRNDQATRKLLIAFEEGRILETEFELGLGSALGIKTPERLIERLFVAARLDPAMIEAVRRARALGIRTGLISNSWGTTRYPRKLLGELFDGIIISGEVGVRKPSPHIYELGAEAIALPPESCVFVDDLPFNLPPAERLGMAVIHHAEADETIVELERLLGLSLCASA